MRVHGPKGDFQPPLHIKGQRWRWAPYDKGRRSRGKLAANITLLLFLWWGRDGSCPPTLDERASLTNNSREAPRFLATFSTCSLYVFKHHVFLTINRAELATVCGESGQFIDIIRLLKRCSLGRCVYSVDFRFRFMVNWWANI